MVESVVRLIASSNRYSNQTSISASFDSPTDYVEPTLKHNQVIINLNADRSPKKSLTYSRFILEHSKEKPKGKKKHNWISGCTIDSKNHWECQPDFTFDVA